MPEQGVTAMNTEVDERRRSHPESTPFWTPRRKAFAAGVAAVGLLEAGARLRHERMAAGRAVATWTLHEHERLGREVRSVALFHVLKALGVKPRGPALRA
jgi:hypothetical protein